MKKIYFIISSILILTISCSIKSNRKSVAIKANVVISNDTLNDKYEVLNDFLRTRIDDKSKNFVIFSEKINTNTTLKWLLHNEIYAIDSITLEIKNKDSEFFRDSEWEIAREKYSKKFTPIEIKNKTYNRGSCCWLPENFNYKNLIFEELDIGSTAYIKKYLMQTEDYEYYSFSDPIFYMNDRYLMFSFTHGSARTITSHSSNLVIYKKQNGKWIQTHIGNPDFVS